MKIPDKLYRELNLQLNKELYSAYLYLSMASQLDSMGFSGFARWMKIQAKEELEHAMKFYEYINDRGNRVVLEAIEKPPSEWESITEMFRHALRHEEDVTRSIEHLVDLARETGDKATEVFLNWFVEEQVEEEKIFSEIVQLLEYAGENPQTILQLNARLGSRGD